MKRPEYRSVQKAAARAWRDGHWSQWEAHHATGLSRDAIRRFIRGECPPSPWTLLQMREFLRSKGVEV